MNAVNCENVGWPGGRAGRVGLVVGVAGLVASTIWGRSTDPAGYEHLWLDVSAGALALAALPLLPRRPVLVALALAALVVVSPAVTPPATVAALYVAYSRGLGTAVGVAVAGLAGHAGQGVWRPNGGLSYGWWLVLMAAAYAALVGWGVLGRARAALLDSLRERARRAEDEQARRVAEARVLERTRIAREMHDALAHRLSLVATYAGALEYRPDASPEQVARAAGVVRVAVHQALDELREVIGVLREGDCDRPGDRPGERPQPALTDVPRLVAESRGAGTPVDVDDRVTDAAEVPAGLGRTAYRIVQEGLTNARRHGPGQPVRLVLDGRPGAGLTVEIRNPVPPASVTPTSVGTGTGLVGLAERVELAGGRLRHEVTPAGDFRLFASLPWPA